MRSGLVIATAFALAATSAAGAAPKSKIAGQPDTPGAQQIGSKPQSSHPLTPPPIQPKTADKVSTPLRTDTAVLGSNVGPGIAPTATIKPKRLHPATPVIRPPPDWRGTADEWEQHVDRCYARVGATDWWTGAYVAAADLLARCPYDRGAQGAVVKAQKPKT